MATKKNIDVRELAGVITSKRAPRGKPWPKGVSGSPERLWKPGESGNPSGRPKTPCTDAYRELVGRVVEAEGIGALPAKPGDTLAMVIAKAVVREAANGNIKAAVELRESIEGKSTQRHELTGAGGGAVKIDLETVMDKMCEFFGVSEALEAIPDQPPKK